MPLLKRSALIESASSKSLFFLAFALFSINVFISASFSDTSSFIIKSKLNTLSNDLTNSNLVLLLTESSFNNSNKTVNALAVFKSFSSSALNLLLYSLNLALSNSPSSFKLDTLFLSFFKMFSF